MKIIGLDSVYFGVNDINESRRFLNDFGLKEIEASKTGALFQTAEGSEIILRGIHDSGLPPAVIEGSTVREIVWGVQSAADLVEIQNELSKDREIKLDSEGVLHAIDPEGYGIAFRIMRHKPLIIQPCINFPGTPFRINQAINFSDRPPICHLGHVVVFCQNFKETTEFYQKRLGFRLSDRVLGVGDFLRASGSHDHHSWFLIGAGNKKGLHHVSFEMREFEDIMVAGLQMKKKNWKTKVGPGRHGIGSNYFWYFESPLGGAVEYSSDLDYVTDEWQSHEWKPSPEITAGWAVDTMETDASIFKKLL
jgi:catechol 2,3-dioxygenase-like lactoylglutathione lyase family enzyme